MSELGWLTATLSDVPGHDRWLSEREREALSALRVRKRRDDWRLGRWVAKAGVAAWRGSARDRIEVLAASDGVPEALIGGTRAPVRLSLSHRAGRALAAVGDGPGTLGCDLEAIEARSAAFVREWLRPTERDLMVGADARLRDLAANLIWSAKEAASKARREGLRLNVRRATVEVSQPLRALGSWERLRVTWGEDAVEHGWWRAEPGWVMVIVSDAADEPPRELR
jgi:4'-phosphopantetheinyl transferase